MKAQLEVFARIKPQHGSQLKYTLCQNHQNLKIYAPNDLKTGYMNNTRGSYQFAYNYVFDENSSQDEVFERIAKPVVMSCLEGYNGTIFAYGQTGSGKTYTMSGAESWKVRGIIPRALETIFQEIGRRRNIEFNCFVSFMEIYNEQAFDLLDRRHMENSMEDWTKVQIMEDELGNIHMKNLSVNKVKNEQDGIDLLMMGNLIRHVSSTPMNQASSRSHCIFTITIEGRDLESETFFHSKLNLVDLAGSERVYKTQVEGNTLVEAKHINLSLSYLEQVILALHEKGTKNRNHIPYRNSLMTTVLKESLGGNCKTVMIATMAMDPDHLEETISTARFSQRCSQLVNEIKKNEKIDVNLYIQKLEHENRLLEQELAYYKLSFGTQKAREEAARFLQTGKLIVSEITQKELDEKVGRFLNDETERMNISTIEEAQSCFIAMKDFYNTRLREYIRELRRISRILSTYDENLTLKKNKTQNVHGFETNSLRDTGGCPLSRSQERIDLEANQRNSNEYVSSNSPTRKLRSVSPKEANPPRSSRTRVIKEVQNRKIDQPENNEILSENLRLAMNLLMKKHGTKEISKSPEQSPHLQHRASPKKTRQKQYQTDYEIARNPGNGAMSGIDAHMSNQNKFDNIDMTESQHFTPKNQEFAPEANIQAPSKKAVSYPTQRVNSNQYPPLEIPSLNRNSEPQKIDDNRFQLGERSKSPPSRITSLQPLIIKHTNSANVNGYTTKETLEVNKKGSKSDPRIVPFIQRRGKLA